MDRIVRIIPHVPVQGQVENAAEQELDTGDDQSSYETVLPKRQGSASGKYVVKDNKAESACKKHGPMGKPPKKNLKPTVGCCSQ